MPRFADKSHQREQGQDEGLLFVAAHLAESGEFRFGTSAAAGNVLAKLTPAEKVQDGIGQQRVPDLVRQIFAVEAQPCERDAHVLDHEQADDARVVGQVGSRRDGRAEEGGKDDGGRGTGSHGQVEALAHAGGDGHEQDVDRDDVGDDRADDESGEQERDVHANGGGPHAADGEQGNTVGEARLFHEHADEHTAHAQPRDGGGPADESHIRGRDARQDVVHQEQDGGDEVRQQVKGEHADRHDRPEPVEVHFRRARVIKAPSHKEATEQARQPAYPLSGQLVGRNGSCHMRSAQCME